MDDQAADTDFTQHAGWVEFPKSAAELADTALCPACFTALTGTVCRTCGLDLNHPAAHELLRDSVGAATLLQARVATIGKMRFQTAEALRRRAAEALAEIPVVQAPTPRDTPRASTLRQAQGGSARPDRLHPGHPDGTGSTDGGGSTKAAGGTPRRSSIQVLLLLVGVSLLSIATIFFLVYAFITYGLAVRSVIIGAITVAAFAVTSLLGRRGLTATAEGIGCFAVLLIYLDAFAVRANDLFGLASGNVLLYWGVTLVASALGFIAWHRRGAVRAASIAGFSTFAPGVGLIVAGATPHMEGAARTFFSFGAVAAAGVIHWAAGRTVRDGQPDSAATPERILVLSTTLGSLLLAFLGAVYLDMEWDWAPALGMPALALIALVHAGMLTAASDRRLHRAFSVTFAGVAGVGSALAVLVVATRVGDPAFLAFAPAVVAVVLALLFELASRRQTAPRRRTVAATTARSAGIVAVAVLLLPAYAAIQGTLSAVSAGLSRPWSRQVADAIWVGGPEAPWSVLALAVCVSAAAVVWRGALWPSRGAFLGWCAVVTVVLAVPLMGLLWLILLGYLLLTTVALLFLVRSPAKAAYRKPLVGMLAGAAAIGYLTSWSSEATWLAGSLAVLAVLLTSRRVVHTDLDRAALLGGGTVIALVAAAAGAHQLSLAADPAADIVNTARFVEILAILLLAASAVPRLRALSTADRRVTFWLSFCAAVASATIAHVVLTSSTQLTMLLLPEFTTSLIVSIALLGALALWVLVGSSDRGDGEEPRFERVAAAIALGPTVYLIADAFAALLELDAAARSVTPVTSALVAAAGALALTLLRPSVSPRWAREAGIAVVAVPAVVLALEHATDAAWLVLILAGITALLLAIDVDGLFASASQRKHLGWLALALATAGLWRRLAGEEVRSIEPYVLPLTGVLLCVAALIARAAYRRGTPSHAAPVIALAGLLVSVLPLSVNAATGSPVRAMAVGGVSAVLLLAGSLLRGPHRVYLDAAALAGALGVLVTAAGRSVFLLHDTGDARPDAWLAASFLLLLIAGFAQASGADDAWRRQRLAASEILGVVAMTTVLVLELAGATDARLGPIRVVGLALLFSALHVVASSVDRAPLTRRLGVVSIAFAGTAVAVGFGAVHPIELGTVPIAVALLTTGFARLRDSPTARSWPWLGPGFAVLLVPSLVATIDDRPAWRLVALGVVCLAVIVAGAVRRLQAPFIVGITVVLIHGFATFAPQIRAVYELTNWWVWAGIGGVVLIALAAQYERRIQNLKSVAMKIAALR